MSNVDTGICSAFGIGTSEIRVANREIHSTLYGEFVYI